MTRRSAETGLLAAAPEVSRIALPRYRVDLDNETDSVAAMKLFVYRTR